MSRFKGVRIGRSLGIQLLLFSMVGVLLVAYPSSSSAAAGCARPTATNFVKKMNALEDLPMKEFMAKKADESPCWINWNDDLCTKSPESGKNYNFKKSCQRHDFAYRNSKRLESWYGVDGWSYHNKAVADTGFRRDMTNHCYNRDSWEIEDCLAKRSVYYKTVATLGDFASTLGDYRYTFTY